MSSSHRGGRAMKETALYAAWMIAASVGTTSAAAQPVVPAKGMPRMPVKEVTVFKDGHAFVLHAGRVATSDAGHVVLDELPSPVLGTFWPYVSDRRARLTSVTTGRSDVRVERTAVDLR